MDTPREPAERVKVLEVENLVAQYGERIILDGVSLDVHEGEIMFIGTPDELRDEQSERIQNLLHRRTEAEIVDPEEYLRHLIGERLDKDGHP